VHLRPPILPLRSVGQVSSRPSIRIWSQSNTSASTHPTLLGPSCTRLGNKPAFSSRATCCGEYRTNSFSWGFESILITISPSLKSIAMPKVTTIPRQVEVSSPIPIWRVARFPFRTASIERTSPHGRSQIESAWESEFQSLLRA
jgi:hypothetical protein